MEAKSKDKKQEITAFFRSEESFFCCGCYLCLILIGLFVIWIVLDIQNLLSLYFQIFIGFFIILSIICIFTMVMDCQEYCEVCNKRVLPIFRDHICNLKTPKNSETLRSSLRTFLNKEIEQSHNDVKEFDNSNLFENKKEKAVFKNNLLSLKYFEFLQSYKYCMVAMGSILEFLIKKYCKRNQIPPETYHNAQSGAVVNASKKHFINYVQSAINNDIFNKKKRWQIVQSHLRDFRNYVHINKEVKEELIDKSWYATMKPIFESLYESFKGEQF